MARDGSGNYNAPSPQNPVVTGTTIDADDHNTTVADIGAALTASIAKDGQTVPTANLPMGGFRHTNVSNPTTRSQYTTVDFVQDAEHISAGSLSGTNTISCGLSPAISAYVDQMIVIFSPFANNTGAVTLNVNGVAARDVVAPNGDALVAGDLIAGSPAMVMYDLGSIRWVLINPAVWSPLDIGIEVQAWDADLDALAALGTNGLIAKTGAGTVSGRTLTGTASRTTVTNGDGVAGNPTVDISTSYVGQATITTLGTITTGTWTGTDVAVADGGTGSSTQAGARTNLGLGTMATQAASAVAITGGTITGGSVTGITDITVADGGTGASDAAAARTNLGLVIGTNVVAPTLAGVDFTGLTTIEGNALVAGDDFLVMDDTTAKRIQYSDAGMPVETVAGTTDTLATAKMNTFIEYTSGTAVAVTLNTGVGKVGNVVLIKQTGTGQVTLSGTATIEASIGLKTRTVHSVITLLCIAADTWSLFGDAST